jgi:hypothetical protein
MSTKAFGGERIAGQRDVRTLLTALAIAVVSTLLPAAATAATIDQIVALTKAGVSEPVILALIDRDKTIYDIEPERLVTLKQQGVSEAVLLAMLKSGRAEGEQAAQAEAASRASSILSSLSVAPEVLIVGHGPENLNTTHYGYPFYPGYDYPAYPATGYAPAVLPIPVPFAAYSGSPRRSDAHRDRMLCLAQTTGRGGPGGPVASWVTECPPVMQRAFRRTTR